MLSEMKLECLADLLRQASLCEGKGLTIYSSDTAHKPIQVSYLQLLRRASENANILRQLDGFSDGQIILLHFDNHYDNVVWFWSTILARGVPAISPPFTNALEQRKQHLDHLHKLLDNPICLTRDNLLPEFACQDSFNLKSVDSDAFSSGIKTPPEVSPVHNGIDDSDRPAVLMFTSGSTGNVKAVALNDRQIITALRGKSEFHGTKENDTFLNWINLDHVANLTEIHLHAMYLGCDQIHVPAPTIIHAPLGFLELLSKHEVAYTFAPNFLLFHLEKSLRATELDSTSLNLSRLRCLISGGEATVVDTCSSLSELLQQLGAPANLIRPGFGMTETCAGSIYNTEFPAVDVGYDREFASLGRCIPGAKLRVTVPGEGGRIARAGEQGQLEMSGPIIFSEYYKDPVSTKNAFTADGWFRTGDLAFIDDDGNMNLSGRTKEVVNINGIKSSPQSLENAIAEACIEGVTPSFTVAFSYRPRKSHTEHVCVVYLPSFDENDWVARATTNDAICKTVMLCIGARPYVLPLSKNSLQKSTLGKLSRAKIQANFIAGEYSRERQINDEGLQLYHSNTSAGPADEFEELLLRECMDHFGFSSHDMGVETNILDLGANSIELLRWKRRLQTNLKIADVPVITIMTCPTVRLLAAALKELQKPHEYDPLVVLQSQGDKTPLWLVHPGIGEVLVFIGLAKYMMDRPVYALRARGFDGERHFKSIPEALQTYHDVIKKQQPTGPYAIAGYSYGSLLAFELTKKMTDAGDEIKFLGSFNLAPHVKWRMRQLDWTEALLNLSHFLKLLEPDFAMSLSDRVRKLESHDEMTSLVIELSAPGRLQELGLNHKKLREWADVAMGLHDMARDYDPSGMVAGIDVFVATPLIAVAKSREEWMEKHLRFWADFAATPPRFHSVQGEHYTMLGPDNIHTFQKTLKSALANRGI